jgi:hypothetical protein
MNLLSIFVIRDADKREADDLITFTTDPLYPDLVEITSKFFKTPQNLRYKSTVDRSRCPHFVRTLLRSLIHDDEPFEQIQFNSALFPSVLYNVSDLACDRVNSAIDDLVHITFDYSVRRTLVTKEE